MSAANVVGDAFAEAAVALQPGLQSLTASSASRSRNRLEKAFTCLFLDQQMDFTKEDWAKPSIPAIAILSGDRQLDEPPPSSSNAPQENARSNAPQIHWVSTQPSMGTKEQPAQAKVGGEGDSERKLELRKL